MRISHCGLNPSYYVSGCGLAERLLTCVYDAATGDFPKGEILEWLMKMAALPAGDWKPYLKFQLKARGRDLWKKEGKGSEIKGKGPVMRSHQRPQRLVSQD
jgi:hypothetical protein